MDPLSIVASIVALAGMTDTAFKRGYRLAKQVKNADESIAALFREVNELGGVLYKLTNITDQLGFCWETVKKQMCSRPTSACSISIGFWQWLS
jgi:hypothetical protein